MLTKDAPKKFKKGAAVQKMIEVVLRFDSNDNDDDLGHSEEDLGALWHASGAVAYERFLKHVGRNIDYIICCIDARRLMASKE